MVQGEHQRDRFLPSWISEGELGRAGQRAHQRSQSLLRGRSCAAHQRRFLIVDVSEKIHNFFDDF